VFSDRVLYPSYTAMPRLFGFSAQHDQAASGAIMWVMGSLAFLVPAVVIAVQCLSSTTSIGKLPLVSARSDWLVIPRPIAALLAWLRRRFGARRLEVLTFVIWFAIAGIGLAALAVRPSDDDDQTLRMRANSGPFAVAVFSAPGDLTAGANTFSVLVQDSATQEVLLAPEVQFSGRPVAGGRETSAVRASPDDSNKLLQSAQLDLPAGDWSLLINVRDGARTAEVNLPLHVAKLDGGFTVPWSWRVLIAFAVLLLVVCVRRDRARRALSSSPAAPALDPELDARCAKPNEPASQHV